MATHLVSTKPTPKYYAVAVAFTSSVLFFFFARAPEIISMSINNPLQGMCVAVSIVALLTFFIAPPVLTSSLIRRLGLICLVLYSLKSEMDPALTKLTKLSDLTNTICLVTGANSGTGFAISQLLVERGATVIMACRSVKKCKHASSQIAETIAKIRNNITVPGVMEVMELDLGDLASVKAFTLEFAQKYSRIDVLVNNAGLLAPAGLKTVQGYEASFGVMHIGHFALTKWLMPLLLKPLPETIDAEQLDNHPFQLGARVVNLGSQAYSFGYFDESLMEGTSGSGDLSAELTDNCGSFGPFNMFPCCPAVKCPVTNGYARAKLANLLHIHELQRRSDLNALEQQQGGGLSPRRIVTSVLHPGSVRTGIHWTLEAFGPLLRTSAQAAHVILHAIQSDSFIPGSYIDCMGAGHDLMNLREEHLPVHLEAFPSALAAQLPFILGPGIKLFSFEAWAFKGKNLIANTRTGPPATVSSQDVATRLWDVSERIVADWEKEVASE